MYEVRNNHGLRQDTKVYICLFDSKFMCVPSDLRREWKKLQAREGRAI